MRRYQFPSVMAAFTSGIAGIPTSTSAFTPLSRRVPAPPALRVSPIASIACWIFSTCSGVGAGISTLSDFFGFSDATGAAVTVAPDGCTSASRAASCACSSISRL